MLAFNMPSHSVLCCWSQVLSSSPVGQRAAAQDVLSRLGVEVVTGEECFV